MTNYPNIAQLKRRQARFSPKKPGYRIHYEILNPSVNDLVRLGYKAIFMGLRILQKLLS